MKEILRPAFALFLGLTVITGIAYPLLVTAVAQVLFPRQAAGSRIERGGKLVGSELIGQPFAGPRYFWGRPSATSPIPDNGASSTGSNLGPTNPALKDAVTGRMEALRKAHPDQNAPPPVDLVTASGSGLDPHLTPAAIEWQVSRVSKARGMSEPAVRAIVARNVEERTFGVLGERRVNVLKLNLALDAASTVAPK
ncbi:MAG TPA: potassium-transporting ATPase subunit KdpC [Planctomycetia bacterium]|nr:potassium-transporting ATPase subunit KdpC [Planctomycetia bacterium]